CGVREPHRRRGVHVPVGRGDRARPRVPARDQDDREPAAGGRARDQGELELRAAGGARDPGARRLGGVSGLDRSFGRGFMSVRRRTSRFAAVAAGVLALAASLSAGAQVRSVLPPQQAFPYTVEATPEHLVLEFAILDGYYLYRDKFGFESPTAGVTFGAPRFPDGEVHSDEWFGEQVIFRDRFEIRVPYTAPAGARQLELALGLQGCADIGLCYPPQTWTSTVALPERPPAATTTRSILPGTRGQDDLLPPEQAFVMNARFDGPNELTVAWQ